MPHEHPFTIAIDVGGTGLKADVLDKDGVAVAGRVRVPTTYPMPPHELVHTLTKLVAKLPEGDRVSCGFPGMVRQGHVLSAPHFVLTKGPGTKTDPQLFAAWSDFDLAVALSESIGKPCRVANDADVQGLAVVKGKGFEAVITLGTGFGTAFFMDGSLMPHLEFSHLEFRKGETFNEQIGEAARKKAGDESWNRRRPQDHRLSRCAVLLRPPLHRRRQRRSGQPARPRRRARAHHRGGQQRGHPRWDQALGGPARRRRGGTTMTAVDTEPLAWDPLNEKYKADPHAIWKRLRDEQPLYYNEELDFYAVSRFAEVDAFSRDPKTFVSSHGTVLEMITADPIDMQMMIFMDPPEHTRYRRLVSKTFTPRRMKLLEEDIRTLCANLLDGLVGRNSFDYVQDFGARVPAYVIAALLGVPPEDRDMVRGWIDESFHLDPETGMSNDISAAAMFSFMDYLGKTLADRQTNPCDDMFTDLVNMEITEEDGVPRRLTLEQAVNFAALIGSAGTETVARMLGWAALALDNNPDQRAELVADAGLIPNAVEEILRYEAPSPVQSRWCTADVEVHGGTIPANSKVVMITGSAGRDERAYPDADTFDIHRKFDHHLSFGYGIHFCLGAALARTEGRIALEETFKRFPEWSVDMAGAVPLYTSTVRGYTKLPISV